MDNREQGFPIEEEVVLEGVEGEEMEVQGSEESEVDELLPQPAFHIEEDHQFLTQEEKDAFTYILAVRDQKQAILKRKNHQDQPETITNGPESSQTQQSIDHSEEAMQQLQTALHDWKGQSIQNWRLVVQNLKYLHKNTEKGNFFKEKLNINALKHVPQAYQLCLNQSLTLSHIQRLLVDFSNAHYQAIDGRLNGSTGEGQCNYHLWIYSLLALHQSYASYTNFQALASINAAIQKETQVFQHTLKSGNLTGFKEQVIKWLINFILLIEVFNQKFLKKHLHWVRRCNII